MNYEERVFNKLEKMDDTITAIREQNARFEQILETYVQTTSSIQDRVIYLEKQDEKQKGIMIAIAAIAGLFINIGMAYVKNLFK